MPVGWLPPRIGCRRGSFAAATRWRGSSIRLATRGGWSLIRNWMVSMDWPGRMLWGVPLLFAGSLSAMVFMYTDDPDFNTTPPQGYYADSGWQWQGEWGKGAGTIVSPNQVLTAKHFPAAAYFVHDNKVYPVLGQIDDPHSDLRLATVDTSANGVFDSYAPLFAGDDEVGREVVVFGRGDIRGPPVLIDAALRGWHYQPDAGRRRLRWGTNRIIALAPYGERDNLLLTARFDAGSNPTECHLANWDSGGGIFLRDGGQWKLAGVNYAVDTAFSSVTGDTGEFSAALFDMRGLRQGDIFVPDGGSHVASSFYATRVAARLDWLQANLYRPLPPERGRRAAKLAVAVMMPLAILAGLLWRLRRPRR